jgi:hypothetical protein
MPDSEDSIDPKEATEAKLCAYLEGELAPAERAEIELHLAANPAHRQLLADLAQTREWMRAIPAESSPVDLAENFQGQVERSMLLDESHDGSARWIAHWPQFAMLAAVVALVLGLGVLLFAMLKGPTGGPGGSAGLAGRNFSMAPAPMGSPSTLPVSRATAEMPVMASPKTVDLSGLSAATAAPVVPPPVTMAPVKSLPEASDLEAATAKPFGVARDRSGGSDAESVKQKLARLGYRLPSDQKTVAFVVTADAPANAVDQVQGFFQRHQLAFDDLSSGTREPAVAMVNLDQLQKSVVASTQQDVLKKEKDALPAGGFGGGGVGGGGGGIAAAIGQRAQAQQQQASNQNFAVNGSLALPSTGSASVATTQPADESVYVARGLTPLQLELLSASLATENLNQTVQRVTLSERAATASPATMPANAVARGQTLTVTVAQLVGPGIDKTNAVKVADDGTIALPMIDPLPVAGMPPAEIERRIAAKYRETNLIPQATVTVINGAAATQAVATTLPAATMPTTQAVLPLVQAESGVDVVVVIEKAKSVLPGK